MATQLRYDQCPRVYCKDKAVFRPLLLGAQARTTRMAVVGDSTSTDVQGSGNPYMQHLRSEFHRLYGHTPGTSLVKSYAAHGHPPGDSWLYGSTSLYREVPGIADTQVPAGFTNVDLTFGAFYTGGGSTTTGNGVGILMLLNHHHDNQTSLSLGSNTGFDQVSEFAEDITGTKVGTAAYWLTTMAGSKSLIDAASGLKIEVVALTFPGRDPQVAVEYIPHAASEFENFAPAAAMPQRYALFGGAQTLTAAQGTAYVAQTPQLPALSGAQRYYAATITGYPTINDVAKAVHILGARFVSLRAAGIIMDSFSAGGYSTFTWFGQAVPAHDQCLYCLTAMNHDLYMHKYGINDFNSGGGDPNLSADQCETYTRQFITQVRAVMPNKPFILQAPPDRPIDATYNRTEFNKYAGAMYNISLDTPNTFFINSRLIMDQDYNWVNNEATYLVGPTDVHYSNAGGRVLAQSMIRSFTEGLNVPRGRGRARQYIRSL